MYIYIYTPVFKNVAFLKTYVIYIIMPFLRLHLFCQHQKRHKCKKTEGNGHNGITDDMCPPCLSLFSTVIHIYDIYF